MQQQHGTVVFKGGALGRAGQAYSGHVAPVGLWTKELLSSAAGAGRGAKRAQVDRVPECGSKRSQYQP